MVDIASLSIEINTRDVARAESALDDLARAGGRAESAADNVRDSMRSAGESAGRAGSAAAAAAAGLDRASAAARQQADIMQRAGLSAGQYQQAMRMLPMQLTDVAVSVASGMPIWMVAIQQGGQIRDSFGGMGNAARAVVGAIGPMNLALAGAAATLGTLLLAYESGRRESERFNQALILTGNSAGMTAGQMADLAREMDAMAGVTTSSAAAALAQVAETGRFTGEQIGLVAKAAEQMREATGRSVDETVKEFLRLRADPVKAILDLNDQYHFLTESQLEQIKTLQDQGRQQDAVTASFRAYAGAIAERTPQILQNLGWIERAGRSISGFFSELGDDVRNLGRATGDADRLAQIAQRVAYLRSTLNTGPATEIPGAEGEIARLLAEQEQINTRIAESKKTQGTVDSERHKAEEEWERRTLRYADQRKQLEKEIGEIRAAGLKAGIAQPEIDAQISAATKQFEERQAKANRAKPFTDDAATRMLQQLREQEASLQAQLESTVTLSTARRAQVEWARQLADLKGKAILTAEQKSLLANQDAITAQHAKNAALDEERRRREEIAKLAERAAEVERSVASSLASQREQYGRQLSVIGMGRDARERVQSEASIRQQYQRLQERLNEDMGPGQFNTDQYRQASDSIRKGLDEALAANTDYYSQLEGMQGDWRVGARAAYADYLSDARNVAAQTEGLFTSAFSSMEDAVVEFAMTGKLSFADFTKSILADMARIAARQASSSVLSGLGGVAASAIGGLFGGSAAGSSIADYASVDLSNFRPQAKGGAWIDGVQAFAKGGAFTNSIVSSPTLFPFAKGTGLMGEAGPEAIMPLTRGADGSLGVRSLGGVGSSQILIQAPVTVQAQPGMSSQEAARQGVQMGQAMTAEIRKAIGVELRQGGQIWRALNGR
ncbi:phage tail tape measure protein [Azotobacter beijerinckii]|uniref:phage tail tape measure protein n=1 Tax=Azotobacter beijerinckii TaxID=170623 RepID=UPI0029540692|nr:phage tail tape measure protein [Azotobacter beijerinckii]MDV7209892.1 phage tail tape measure protein [Azotobacter beijerinckii]